MSRTRSHLHRSSPIDIRPRSSRSTEELIRSFQEEHSAVERKTYTKWINQHLARVNDHVTDIFQDLRSGERLTKLLEVLSGESVAVNERGVLRIHHMLNVERALGFLERKSGVQLRQMNIGAEDVYGWRCGCRVHAGL